MPFMAVDSITGYPITKSKDGEYFCTEAYLKRKAFPKSEDEKLFDKMVTEKAATVRLPCVILMEIVWEVALKLKCTKFQTIKKQYLNEKVIPDNFYDI